MPLSMQTCDVLRYTDCRFLEMVGYGHGGVVSSVHSPSSGSEQLGRGICSWNLCYLDNGNGGFYALKSRLLG